MVRLIRAVGVLVVLLFVGVLVVAATGGRFYVGGGVTGCATSDGLQDESGPIPGVVRGGYEASVMIQLGDVTVQPAVTVWVRADAVAVVAEPC